MINLNELTTEMTFQDLLNDGYDKTSLCDSPTWTIICDFFQFRRVQPRFDAFFTRALKKAYPRYEQLLRVDPTITDYDWFVENYREMERRNNGSSTLTREDSHTITKSGLNGGSVTVTGTTGNTRTLNTEDSTTHSSTDGHTGTDSRNTVVGDRNTETYRESPMSANLTGSRSGNDQSQTWDDITNPTSSRDHLETGKTTESGSDGYTDTHSGTDTTTDTGTITDAGSKSQQTTNNLTHSENVSDSVTGESTNEREDLTRSILKGRDRSIAELLQKSFDAIQDSNAVDWLLKELEPCFMQCLD